MRAQEMDASVLFSGETPYANILRHACERYGIAWREIAIANGNQPHAVDSHSTESNRLRLRLDGDHGIQQRLASQRAALADAAVVLLSHRLFALYARPQGKIATWIARRLQATEFDPGSTLVAAHPSGLASPKAIAWERQINAAGAVLWYPNGIQADPTFAKSVRVGNAACQAWSCAHRIAPSTMQIRFHESLSTPADAFLVHCTRGRNGPWPDQSWEEYLDEVLRGGAGCSWHPMDTLLRILRMQRLIATRYLRRGPVETVCLSEERLSTLIGNRRFQPHLGRWDWEPYGIALRRSWLQSLGARPVRYVPHADVAACGSEELSFVQPSGPIDGARDWSFEKEWRIAGDLRLHEVGPNDAWVFVPSEAEARAIAHESRWPVVVVGPMR
jgi:hypothetical protein